MNEIELRNQILVEAKKHLGTSYNVMDCSKFVETVMHAVGLNKNPNDYPRVSSDQGEFLYKKKLTITIAKGASIAEIEAVLKPADPIFWASSKHPERWMEIHHTGIYAGDGKAYESSSSEGKVVLRNLWESPEWQIVFIGDVTSLLLGNAPEAPAEGEEKMIQYGDEKSQAVYGLQNALIALGHDLGTYDDLNKKGADGKPLKTGADGSFGDKTLAGLNDEQVKAGLTATKEVDDATQGALFMALAAKTGTQIKTLQDQVNNLAGKISAGIKALQ